MSAYVLLNLLNKRLSERLGFNTYLCRVVSLSKDT